jgi:glycosyltransferase involved in cell wall biosynthesis
VIYGIAQDEQYRHKIMAIAAADTRVRVAKHLSRQDLPAALANFDLVAVPSQLLETGPLTILEAHALGIPVLGSDLGGISELVSHGINGWLVPSGDIQAWAEALARLATDPDLLRRLQQGIQPVRTLQMEATETAALYHHLLQDKLIQI